MAISRSASLSPPQTPKSSGVPSACARQSRSTGQVAQICLASPSRASRSLVRSFSGPKNSRASAPWHRACSCQPSRRSAIAGIRAALRAERRCGSSASPPSELPPSATSDAAAVSVRVMSSSPPLDSSFKASNGWRRTGVPVAAPISRSGLGLLNTTTAAPEPFPIRSPDRHFSAPGPPRTTPPARPTRPVNRINCAYHAECPRAPVCARSRGRTCPCTRRTCPECDPS